MSNHSGPECVALQRCEALVKGKRKSAVFYDWATKDHQCPRPSQQMRRNVAVCYVHARAKCEPEPFTCGLCYPGRCNGQCPNPWINKQ